jgi:hypothetical protein
MENLDGFNETMAPAKDLVKGYLNACIKALKELGLPSDVRPLIESTLTVKDLSGQPDQEAPFEETLLKSLDRMAMVMQRSID